MLDCKMSTLSPATPLNILTDVYGMWEHQEINPPQIKMDSPDILELIDENQSYNIHTSSLNHQILTNRDCHFHEISQQYLTPLPSMGHPYNHHNASSMHTITSVDEDQCHLLDDNFDCSGNIESSYTSRLSEIGSLPPFSDDLMSMDHHNNHSINNHHHHEHEQDHHHQNLHNDHHQMLIGSSNCPPLPSHQSFQSQHHSNSSQNHHQQQNNDMCQPSPISINTNYHQQQWEDIIPCETGDYILFSSRKDESPSVTYSDIDSEMDSKSSGESLSTLHDICLVSPPKRRVGRPPKKDKKLKRNDKHKTGRLWMFIRDLLFNPEYCPSLVRWENPDEGHFRFVNSEKVAQLWGNIKGNPRMTYEKLSRAMRYYYKSHVFEPVLGRRLVYKFGYNAVNWRPNNPNFASSIHKNSTINGNLF